MARMRALRMHAIVHVRYRLSTRVRSACDAMVGLLWTALHVHIGDWKPCPGRLNPGCRDLVHVDLAALSLIYTEGIEALLLTEVFLFFSVNCT